MPTLVISDLFCVVACDRGVLYCYASFRCSLTMVYLSGYSIRGIAPNDHRILIHGKRYSAISVMALEGVLDVDIVEGSVNGDRFTKFVDNILVPILKFLMAMIHCLLSSWITLLFTILMEWSMQLNTIYKLK